MMAPLHCQVATTIMLLVLPAATALVPTVSIRQIQSIRNSNVAARSRKITKLSLAVDPSEMAQHAHLMHHADPSSILDQLSSFTLAKASIIPNQSLAPLSETIQPPTGGGEPNLLEVIPDMTSMPGGVPRTGNAFLSGSFKDLYNGAVTTSPQTWTQSLQSDGSGAIVVPARELDVLARYADLMDRIPLAAAVYALVDFFLINAEEDVAIAELLQEDADVEAIVEVENRVMMMRIVGLLCVVAATVGWSLLSYHPVPFGEL